MIEALISLRRNGETEVKPEGYVIAVKLAGSPWGNKEKKLHQVVQWEDSDLETALLAAQSAGATYPVITLPYAVYDEEGNITCRSSKTVDLSSLGSSEVNDPNTDAGILSWETIGGLVANN